MFLADPVMVFMIFIEKPVEFYTLYILYFFPDSIRLGRYFDLGMIRLIRDYVCVQARVYLSKCLTNAKLNTC